MTNFGIDKILQKDWKDITDEEKIKLLNYSVAKLENRTTIQEKAIKEITGRLDNSIKHLRILAKHTHINNEVVIVTDVLSLCTKDMILNSVGE